MRRKLAERLLKNSLNVAIEMGLTKTDMSVIKPTGRKDPPANKYRHPTGGADKKIDLSMPHGTPSAKPTNQTTSNEEKGPTKTCRRIEVHLIGRRMNERMFIQ
jgi:hypothetical protein